jgi:hypothetical protein
MAHSTQVLALLTLGYPISEVSNGLVRYPPLAEDGDTLSMVSSILTQISAVDTELSANISDSMAVAVADIRLDYTQYIRQTIAKGDRLLRSLSSLLDLPIKVNRYTADSGKVVYRSAV